MIHPQEATAGTNKNYVIFIVLAVMLIATFLWRLLTPAHEYPMRTEQVMEIGIDLLCLAGLIGLKRQLAGGQVLFWIALVAGLGLFGIRMTSDASWWTGHLVYYLEPR